MMELARQKLFFLKHKILFAKGVRDGKITRFEEEIYPKMENTVIACFPVSLQIKYSDFMFAEGTCYDRSLIMFLGLDNAVRATGNQLDLEYRYGKGHGGHGWVEIGDYVYDPSSMLKFDRELYYELYGCSDINRIDKPTYLREHADFVKTTVVTDFDELRPGGDRRLDLGILVRQVIGRAEREGNEALLADLGKYLEDIQYDANQIREELHKAIQLSMKKEAMQIISGNAMHV